jgi:hypothetical protein
MVLKVSLVVFWLLLCILVVAYDIENKYAACLFMVKVMRDIGVEIGGT